ncbi:hypothetical protein Tco_1007816 [Tanacetum coccineum]
MWETNSYKAHEDHKKLYEALEKSIDRDHSDQLLTDLAEARRKKKKRHDSPKHHLGLHLISHPLLYYLQVHLELQELLELLDHLNCLLLLHLHPPTRVISQKAQLPQALQRQLLQLNIWLGRLLTHDSSREFDARFSKEDRPATPEPAWSIPSLDLPVPMNNWASALTSTYAPPSENLLLALTSDMAIFMDWYCKQQGITELACRIV